MPDLSPKGVLCLVGGGEWQSECEQFDKELLELADSHEVVVLPTAAAYEMPERAVKNAQSHFSRLGAVVKGVMVLNRQDAMNKRYADEVAEAQFIYLSGGSPLHLRSVLKDSLVYGAMLYAYKRGAVLAGSSAGGMVLTDPMADPRGGAFTVGLGLISSLAFVPHFESYPSERKDRTLRLATKSVGILGVTEGCCVMRLQDGTFTERGKHGASAFLNGKPCTIEQVASNVVIDTSKSSIYIS